MENPLGDMPGLEPNNEPPKEESQMPGTFEVNNEQPPVEEAQAEPVTESTEEPAAEEPKAKKPFFTMGKIMAIFGVLLIVGTVVGAIIYSQSSDRFQGATTLNRAIAPVESGISTVTTSEVIKAADTFVASEDKAVTCTAPLVKQTDPETGTEYCMCPTQTYPLLSVGATTLTTANVAPSTQCIPFECDLTQDELSKMGTDILAILNQQNLDDKFVSSITSAFSANYIAWNDKNCKVEEITAITTEVNRPAVTINTPEEKVVTCTDPLTKQEDADGNEYCMCPVQTYPILSQSTSLATANFGPSIQCVPFKCDLTQEELTKIGSDILTILNGQNLSDASVSSITANFSASLKAWVDKYCQQKIVEPTCDEYKVQLSTAYFAGSWDKYAEVLKLMQDNKCLQPCELLFYRAVMYLSQNQLAEARKLIDEYINTCTDECTLTYGMLSLYAEALSNMPTTLTTANIIPAEDLARLKELVIKYIENCQCFEIEAFLTAPGFPENDYFSSGNSAGIRTAYAQSLSPTVMGVIEDAYNDLCVPEDEPKSCTTLTISEPSSTGTDQINQDYDPATDVLKFTVDNDELVTGYKISSQTVVFDGDSESITTDKMEVSLDGGPTVGSEDIITVTALEVDTQVVTHAASKETCSAELKVVRPPENPPDDDPDPVCRSLEIVSPGDAAEPGVPSIELTEGEYTNKVLEIKVDADPFSVDDYKYSSANGYITFNGETTLYTQDKTVVMEGVVPEGETETISVWAREYKTLVGIQNCNDGYIVTVPEEEEPPPPEDPPPPTTVTEEPPPPPIKETVVPSTPAPVTPAPVHAAAPAAPETGPGVLIYLVGAGLGGALLRKKKQ